MRFLIVFGTTEGQTRKIARFMEEKIQSHGHQVEIADATDEPPSASQFDSIIIGSSIHVHKFNPAIRKYIFDNLESLNSRPSTFFSVSMAIASDIKEEHEDIYNLTNSFLDECNWRPHKIHHLAGALRYTKYNYFKKLVMRMISKRHEGATDTSKDHEYTNWKDVEDFILEFMNTEKS